MYTKTIVSGRDGHRTLGPNDSQVEVLNLEPSQSFQLTNKRFNFEHIYDRTFVVGIILLSSLHLRSRGKYPVWKIVSELIFGTDV